MKSIMHETDPKKIIQIAKITFIVLTILIFNVTDSVESSSFYLGNWDNHVGGCWIADITNCIGCSGVGLCFPFP